MKTFAKSLAFPALLLCGLLLSQGAVSTHAVPPPESRPLSPELLARKPVSLLPDDVIGKMRFRNNAESTPPATIAWNKKTGGAPVLRAECFNRPKYADHVDAVWNFRQPAKKGDVMLARFFVRAEYAKQESGEAMFDFVVVQHKPEYAAHVKIPLTAGPDWALMEIPFAMSRDADASQGTIHLSFGTIPQAVEVCGLEVLNFENRAKVSELPQTRFTYKGREAGAPWRAEALARIEKIRTVPIEVRVIDADGKPVSGASIEARLARPAFHFGTSISSFRLLDDTPDMKKYREQLLALFDTAVIENGMKWPVWSGSDARRQEAMRAHDWLYDNGLRQRGHCLVWPADKFSPRRIAQMPAPRANLPLLIKERIRDIMTTTKGRISSWDVVNEMIHERDYFKYMPETEAAEWFKLAREIDPAAKRFINDYGMLNSRKSPETISKYLEIVKRLRAAGAPIDGLGIQSHIGRQMRAPTDVLDDLNLLASAGLELQVTEFDINTADEDLQADYTRDFLIALYSHPAVTGFTMWGFWEGEHWKPDAAMFRKDWTEKPNLKVWRDLVRTQWHTRAAGTTNERGEFQARGHLGDYEFVVTQNNKPYRQMRTITKSDSSVVIHLP